MRPLRCFASLFFGLLLGCESGAAPGPLVPERPREDLVLSRQAPESDGAPTSIAGTLIDHPESVLYDEHGDVYLVSNLGGLPPFALDGDGFISRVDPETFAVSGFIGAALNGETLHAPKGMAIVGNVLYVSDVNAVKLFDRTSGDLLDVWPVPTPSMTFLNDLCAGPDGALYGTNNGDQKVYRFESDGTPVVIAGGPDVANPNGCEVVGDNVFAVRSTQGQPGTVYRINSSGKARTVGELPTGILDGIVRMNGWFAVSSWAGQAVYAVGLSGETGGTIMAGVASPADLGYDGKRNRLLLPRLCPPSFCDGVGEVLIQPLK